MFWCFSVTNVALETINTFPSYCCSRCSCQQYKCSVLPLKCNNGAPFLCCRTTKYFLLLLTMISVKHYECLSVFFFQLSFLRRIILSPVACLVVPCSSTLSNKGTIFEKKNYLIQNVFYLLYNYCLKYFSF